MEEKIKELEKRIKLLQNQVNDIKVYLDILNGKNK